MADHPQDAHRVAGEAPVRVADHADEPRLQVPHPADVVDDGAVFDLVEQGVDGQVAAEGVLLERAKGVVGRQHLVLALEIELAAGAQGRHLDDLVAPEEHLHQAETPADGATVAEQLAQLARPGVGGDVEVLGCAAQVQVAHPAADQVALEAGVAQAVEHLERLPVQLVFADGVARLGDDGGGGRYRGSLVVGRPPLVVSAHSDGLRGLFTRPPVLPRLFPGHFPCTRTRPP